MRTGVKDDAEWERIKKVLRELALDENEKSSEKMKPIFHGDDSIDVI